MRRRRSRVGSRRASADRSSATMTAQRWTRAADTVLDRLVVPGYSLIGPRVRKRWWPADPAPGSLRERHVIVTGASSGLGTATARGLADLGATVHLVGRTVERLDTAADAIRAAVPHADLVVDVCDVSDLAD